MFCPFLERTWFFINIFSGLFRSRDKPQNSTNGSAEKFDGAIATIMALDRAIRCGNSNSASVYDDRGILFLW